MNNIDGPALPLFLRKKCKFDPPGIYLMVLSTELKPRKITKAAEGSHLCSHSTVNCINEDDGDK